MGDTRNLERFKLNPKVQKAFGDEKIGDLDFTNVVKDSDVDKKIVAALNDVQKPKPKLSLVVNKPETKNIKENNGLAGLLSSFTGTEKMDKMSENSDTSFSDFRTEVSKFNKVISSLESLKRQGLLDAAQLNDIMKRAEMNFRKRVGRPS